MNANLVVCRYTNAKGLHGAQDGPNLAKITPFSKKANGPPFRSALLLKSEGICSLLMYVHTYVLYVGTTICTTVWDSFSLAHQLETTDNFENGLGLLIPEGRSATLEEANWILSYRGYSALHLQSEKGSACCIAQQIQRYRSKAVGIKGTSKTLLDLLQRSNGAEEYFFSC